VEAAVAAVDKWMKGQSYWIDMGIPIPLPPPMGKPVAAAG